MSDTWYKNQPVSKDNAKVFNAANCCIYCPDGKPPFTREHVIQRGLGGGIIFPKASCETCRNIIRDVETYCMRGPFLSHRLKVGLVNDLEDLGDTITMPIIVDGKRQEKIFPVSEYPNFLVLPAFHDPPGLLTGRTDNAGRVSFSIWGDETQLRALHAEGNAILVENFDLDKFGRALAKIAHGVVAGELGLENLEPLLQVGLAFVDQADRVRVDVRIRLFAAYANTPVYRVLAAYLTKPLDENLAPRGLRSVSPNG